MQWLSGEKAALARAGFTVMSALALASCGGGGGGSAVDPTSGLVASSSVAQHCAAPRSGSTDEQGTVRDEQSWVRSWIDETYLWYPDVRALSSATLDATNYTSAISYFNALKSPLFTTSGKAKDQFHFIYDTPTWIALSQSGVSYGYGFEFAWQSNTPPRKAVIVYSNAGTPAATNGVGRGAQILAIDGVDLVTDNTSAGIATLNAGLFPTTTGNHVFTVLDLGAAASRNVTLAAGALAPSTVQNVKALPAPNQSVGYMQ